MVRIVENKIISKFQKLDEYLTNLAQLKSEIKNEKNFLEDFHLYGLAERYLQLSCQIVLDVVDLLIIGEGYKKPADRSESISSLFNRNIISEKTASKLQGISGFRNILVHEYGEIDRKKVYKVLQIQTKDLEEFKKEILIFIKKNLIKNKKGGETNVKNK